MEETRLCRLSMILSKLPAYRPPVVKVPPPWVILDDINVVNPGRDRHIAKLRSSMATGSRAYRPASKRVGSDLGPVRMRKATFYPD